MRKLTKEEKELTCRNLENQKSEIRTLQENLKYNQAIIEQQRINREFEDRWKPYLRHNKDLTDKKTINLIKSEIENRNEIIKIAEKQIKEGVEEKKKRD